MWEINIHKSQKETKIQRIQKRVRNVGNKVRKFKMCVTGISHESWLQVRKTHCLKLKFQRKFYQRKITKEQQQK